MRKRKAAQTVLIGSYVAPAEQRLIRAAASLCGETVSAFLKRIAVPAAMHRLQHAAKDGFAESATLHPAA